MGDWDEGGHMARPYETFNQMASVGTKPHLAPQIVVNSEKELPNFDLELPQGSLK